MASAYKPSGFCPHCGYRMDAGRCPECGAEVVRPAKHPPHATRRRRLISAAIVAVLLSAGYAAVHYRTELAIRYWPPRHIKKLAQGKGPLAAWANRVRYEQRYRRMAAEEGSIKQREAIIREELATLRAHDWAGEYSAIRGTGGGPWLLLAPRAGFVFRWSSCTDNASNHGDVVEVTPERIVLRPTVDPDAYDLGPATGLFRVTWRGRKFLVESPAIDEFVNAVNQRENAVAGYYMHRHGDATLLEPEWPQIAEPFRSHVLAEPLNANVTGTGRAWVEPEPDGGVTRYLMLTLDIGVRQGAFVGMQLFPCGREGYYFGATIRTLRETDADAEFLEYFDPGEQIVMPTVGWQFTTLGPFAEYNEDFGFRWLDGEPPDEDAESSDSEEDPRSSDPG